MPDYKQGCIYKIKHNEDYDNANIYIGSTCNFIRRKNNHKNSCNNEKHNNYNTPLYQYIRENGGWGSFIMIKIHNFPCENKYDLNIEERRVIDSLKPNLNTFSTSSYRRTIPFSIFSWFNSILKYSNSSSLVKVKLPIKLDKKSGFSD